MSGRGNGGVETREVVVIGAGLAGIACARALHDAGRDALVLDKGRGLGGRMATRRTERGPLDHGAPWIEAQGSGFARAVAAMVEGGHAAAWTEPAGRRVHAGLPGMSGALRGLAQGLDRRASHEVREARREGGGWRLAVETPEGPAALAARHLVSTVPVPQARALLGGEPGLLAALEPVRMAPCWTLLAWLDPPRPLPALRDAGDVALLSDEGAKPGRAPGGLVLHASAAWTAPRLEMEREEAARALLDLLAEALGERPAPAFAAAHRWRYARTEAPLGRPFLAAPGLRLGGDWCLGPGTEDAWASGTAVARDLLAAGGEAP